MQSWSYRERQLSSGRRQLTKRGARQTQGTASSSRMARCAAGRDRVAIPRAAPRNVHSARGRDRLLCPYNACASTHVSFCIHSCWSDSGRTECSDIDAGQDQEASQHQSDTDRLIVEPG